MSVHLLGGEHFTVKDVQGDRYLDLNVAERAIREVTAKEARRHQLLPRRHPKSNARPSPGCGGDLLLRCPNAHRPDLQMPSLREGLGACGERNRHRLRVRVDSQWKFHDRPFASGTGHDGPVRDPDSIPCSTPPRVSTAAPARARNIACRCRRSCWPARKSRRSLTNEVNHDKRFPWDPSSLSAHNRLVGRFRGAIRLGTAPRRGGDGCRSCEGIAAAQPARLCLARPRQGRGAKRPGRPEAAGQDRRRRPDPRRGPLACRPETLRRPGRDRSRLAGHSPLAPFSAAAAGEAGAGRRAHHLCRLPAPFVAPTATSS